MKTLINGLLAIVCVVCPAVAVAQTTAAPEPPPPTWVGSAGVGLSLTSGNSDTLNYNLTFDVTRTPKARNVIEFKALYLRGEQNGVVAVDRTSVGVRDQYTLSSRAYMFGQVDYLRDTFKRIDYLVAPAVGVGLKVIDTEATTFSVDAGIGSISEKNPGVAARTNAALTATDPGGQGHRTAAARHIGPHPVRLAAAAPDIIAPVSRCNSLIGLAPDLETEIAEREERDRDQSKAARRCASTSGRRRSTYLTQEGRSGCWAAPRLRPERSLSAYMALSASSQARWSPWDGTRIARPSEAWIPAA